MKNLLVAENKMPGPFKKETELTIDDFEIENGVPVRKERHKIAFEKIKELLNEHIRSGTPAHLQSVETTLKDLENLIVVSRESRVKINKIYDLIGTNSHEGMLAAIEYLIWFYTKHQALEPVPADFFKFNVKLKKDQ